VGSFCFYVDILIVRSILLSESDVVPFGFVASSLILPWGQMLHSTQLRFSLPWGQPIHSAQLPFTLP
jgi:hypothetical protein